MTREQLKAMLPVMQAWCEGKQVQLRTKTSAWQVTEDPNWTPHVEYRIKPEPREWWLCLSCGTYCAVGHGPLNRLLGPHRHCNVNHVARVREVLDEGGGV